MSRAIITESKLTDIADAIRARNGSETTYRPGDMPAAIAALPNIYTASDEGKVVSSGALIAQTARASEITENGTYDTTENNSIIVNVSGYNLPDGVYAGASIPSSSVGNNGDLYIQQPNTILPSGAKFVEYLQSNSISAEAQYITTDVYGSDDLRIYLKTSTTNDIGRGYIFGARQAGQNRDFGILNNTGNDNVIIRVGTTSNSFSNSVCPVGVHTFEYTDKKFFIDGVNKKDISPSSFTTPYPIVLFGCNNNGSVQSYTTTNIYRILLANSTVVLRDYLPAVDDNGVAGMFEAIRGIFVYDSGPGSRSMTAGNEITLNPFRYEYRKINGAWVLDRWVIQ